MRVLHFNLVYDHCCILMISDNFTRNTYCLTKFKPPKKKSMYSWKSLDVIFDKNENRKNVDYLLYYEGRIVTVELSWTLVTELPCFPRRLCKPRQSFCYLFPEEEAAEISSGRASEPARQTRRATAPAPVSRSTLEKWRIHLRHTSTAIEPLYVIDKTTWSLSNLIYIFIIYCQDYYFHIFFCLPSWRPD